MYSLAITKAVAYVRQAIDEINSSESYGLIGEAEILDVQKLVEGYFAEAVINVHTLAPALLMEGIMATEGTDYDLKLDNGVVTITMKMPTVRVVSAKCSDSDIVLTDLLSEDSAEGRKQLDKYVRGTYDDPRIVLQKKWAGEHMPILKYYTAKEDEASFDLEIIPYPAASADSALIAPRLEYAVLNYITAMLLDSFKEHERAELYKAKAKEEMGGQA